MAKLRENYWNNNSMKDKLLILDLDETLVFATEEKLERKADLIIQNIYVYKRPYLDFFIEEMNQYYQLAIWSSGGKEYVEAVTEYIIPNEIDLQFVWSRERCTLKRDIELDQYFFLKNLKKVKKLGFALEKMLIVDNTPSKVSQNYGNAIYPTDFEGAENDDELLHLTQYLKLLTNVDNVRGIEKRGWKEKVKNSSSF